VLRAPVLNILTFGDQIATGLGAHVERERALFLLIAVALSGSCVAVGGGISFLGLIVPHIMGRLLGRRQLKYLIPLTALMGAFFLLLADTLARSVWAPDEIPVGLIVSIIGAPYFIYLLLRR
jgi:iron complex transport system permease protein